MKTELHTCVPCGQLVESVLYMPFYRTKSELAVHKVCQCCIDTFASLDIELATYKTEKEARKHK